MQKKKKKKSEYSKIFQMEFVPILRWMNFGGEEVEESLQEDG